MARKLPGVVQNSLRGANKQNVSETSPPKRPGNGSSNEAIDLHETSAAKESELNLGSLFGLHCMGGFPVARSQNYLSCALSVQTPR